MQRFTSLTQFFNWTTSFALTIDVGAIVLNVWIVCLWLTPFAWVNVGAIIGVAGFGYLTICHRLQWMRSDRLFELRQAQLRTYVDTYERGVRAALGLPASDPDMPDAARWSPKLLEDTMQDIDRLLSPEEG